MEVSGCDIVFLDIIINPGDLPFNRFTNDIHPIRMKLLGDSISMKIIHKIAVCSVKQRGCIETVNLSNNSKFLFHIVNVLLL